MYGAIKEASKDEITKLKEQLQKLADQDFYLEMRDGWKHREFELSEEIHNNIQDIISQLAKHGIKAEYHLGYPIKYSELPQDDQDWLAQHNEEIDAAEQTTKELSNPETRPVKFIEVPNKED